MFKKIFIVAIVATTITACGKSKSGFKYSQDVVAKERSLQPDIERTEGNVSRYVTMEQYDSIAYAGKQMEDIVQNKIEEIEKMPVPNAKGAADFKAAIMRYFAYIKSMYTGYKNWGSAPTPEERDAKLEDIKKLVQDKDDAISEMQAAQKKYADDNGFKIEK
jgi:hypothetical protein